MFTICYVFSRILCYNAGIHNEELFGKHEKIYQQPEMGRIFAIEYNPNSKHIITVDSLLNFLVFAYLFRVVLGLDKTLDPSLSAELK